MKLSKHRVNPEGNYPHYSGKTDAPDAEAYAIVTHEGMKMVWTLVQKFRKKPFHKSVLNYSVRQILGLATNHLEFNHGLKFELSEGAKALKDSQEGNLYKGQIIVEHPVPMKVIIQDMLDNATSKEHCLEILHKWSRITIVTKEEDARLNKNYQTKMPEDWDGIDVWARYRKVGIKVLCDDYES